MFIEFNYVRKYCGKNILEKFRSSYLIKHSASEFIVQYRWTRKIFWTGYNKDLEESDLYVTLKQNRTSYLGEIIANAWKKEIDSCAKRKNGSTPRLLKILLRYFGLPYLFIGIAEAVMELISRYPLISTKKSRKTDEL